MRANSGWELSPGGLLVRSPDAVALAAMEALESAGVARSVALRSMIKATLANDSILVTPGAGATVATHLVGGKEHQVVMLADPDGHVVNSREDWLVFFTPATNAANRRVGDLFNADATALVRVRGVWVIPTVTAITGVAIEFIMSRTSAVGTGGTTMTPRPLDTNFAALDSDITARAGATGGATVVHEYLRQYHINEETNAATALTQHQNLLPSSIGNRVAEVVLRQNQGLMVQQGGAGTVGLTGCLMYFIVE